jgi:transformation/transcription domain-associated protein
MDTGPDKSSPGDTSKTPRDDDNATGTPSSATTPAGQTPASVTSFTSMSLPKSPARLSPHSVASFRVLTECPLIVMLMFQLYPKYLRGNISTLIQVMMEALGLRPPSIDTIEHRYQQALRAVASTQQSIIDAESTTTPTQSNSPQKDRQNDPKLDGAARRRYFSKCRELVAAQAKTLSFLTYLLRGFSNDLKPYEDRLAGNVISLMANCPREFISTRKELLVASRHLLNSEFRNGFFRHVDALLDEKNLMGSHHRSDSEQSALRPLVYAMLSDLVQQMRSLLSLRQISRVVTIFSRVLHDTSIPGSTQYTAVRTLLTVVDSAFQSKDPDIQLGRDILVRVLRTLVEKLSSLNAQRDSMEKNGTSGETCCNTNRDETSTPVDPKQQPLKDQKNIVKAIIVGAKTLIWYINNYRNQREKEKVDSTPPRIGTNEEIASALAKITHTERDLIDRYIVLAFPSIDMMKEICAEDEEATPGDAERAAAEAYRETLTYFASAFTSLDGYELRKILGKRLDVFVNAVKDDSTAIVVPRHLLSANKSTSFEFCSMMLNFLVERMDNLALSTEENVRFFSVMTDDEASSTNQITLLQTLFKDNESHQKNDLQGISSAYLQLFERVLKSLSAYPENERAVRPHLKSIVAMCVRGCCETTDFRANNYCMLLRYVFRSISAGKFEESYRELFPLIPGVLNGLFRVLSSTRLTPLRHTLIELVVTVPARLSTLLPHLNLLLRVIVLALDSSCEELINLGLRTLEFWLDNLNPEYLFPEVSKDKKVYVAVMKALSTHLKPAPYPYGLLTLRLLGKLGGKNRQVLRDPIDICDPKLILNRINDEFSLECEWLSNSANAEGVNDTQMEIDRLETKTFSIHLPLSRCVELLKRIALVQTLLDEGPVVDESSSSLRWMGCEQLNSVNISNLDLLPFCKDVIHNTSVGQAKAALKILRTSLVTILNTDAASRGVTRSAESSPEMQVSASNLTLCNNQLHAIALGCLFGCFLGNEEVLFTKGLLAEMFAIVSRNEEHIVRVDSNGSVLEIAQAEESKVGNEEFGASSDDEKMGSLRPFGYFEMNGPFESTANPLVVTRALAQFLSQPSDSLNALGLDILKYILELPKTIHVSKDRDESKHSVNELDRGSMIFFESLLSSFCEHCIASDWSTRDGLFDGLCLIVETLGSGWAKRYECELMNVVLFSVKSAPHEISIAGVKSFQFMMRLCSNIYGTPHFIQSPSSAKPFMFDLLSPWKKKDIVSMEDKPAHNTSDSPKIQSVSCPSDDVLQIVINEMASTKYMAR